MNHGNVALQSEKREGGELIFAACGVADLINNGKQVGGKRGSEHYLTYFGPDFLG